MPDFTLEEAAERDCGGLVAGLDEAGRGPWAGPVVAAAVILDKAMPLDRLDDSKLVAEEAREALFEEICERAIVGVGIVDVPEIDRLNILHASLLAMQTAFARLREPAQSALVDGNRAPDLPCPARAVVGGDARSASIAAASIVAKVTRDRLMRDLDADFPQYGWARNKGYGTQEHAAALVEHGVTIHHRRSFAPVARLLEPHASR
ncbi:ribonuclease HII [Dichotomicrobium thermohalophilum]|uniref:Ribonuclease HII n=1 Tax=Dichotomicrobium thermohalophilum TaxID=933063 RepID=A0A397PAG6_9HYPH|nr:ribonuclease HII [Dichotomicrobium thermohalophilum]RIA45383.1 RNase HII [Dichotomicrobium thermohalophilum]